VQIEREPLGGERGILIEGKKRKKMMEKNALEPGRGGDDHSPIK